MASKFTRYATRAFLSSILISLIMLNLANSGASAQSPSPAPTPVQSATVQKMAPLQGRIEEIVRGGYSLPEQVVLKKQVPRTDGSLSFNQSLNAWAPIYPESLIGKWGGTLKTNWASVSPAAIPNTLSQIGNTGKVIFDFEKTNGAVNLQPTVIHFPAVKMKMNSDSARGYDLVAEDKDKFLRDIQSNPMVTLYPLLYLSKGNFFTVQGGSSRQDILRNSLRKIQTGVFEQDVIESTYKNNQFDMYREIVTRFTSRSSDWLYAQVVVAEYGADRKVMRRWMMQGWLGRNYRTVEAQIADARGLPYPQIEKLYGLK